MALDAAVRGAGAPAESRNPFAGPQYRWWWAMSLCVSLATGAQIVNVPTYVLDRTETRFFVALAVLCQTVPAALCTLPGGAAADRFGRGRIIRATIVLGAGTAAVFVALSAADVRAIWPVFVIAAVVGASMAFQNPARQSLINLLAPGPRLQNGVIWGTLAFMGGSMFLGPALAGFAIALFGLTGGFLLAVALFVLAAWCATRLRGFDTGTPAPGGMAAQIVAGLGYVRREARLWQVLVLGAVPGMFFMGVGQAAFPVFAKDTFARGAEGIAMLNAGMGCGTLAGSVLLTRWGPRHARGQWFVRAVPVGGIAYVLTGLAPTLPLAVLALVVMGLGAAVFINFATTLLQTYAEPRFIGRVMSIYSLSFMAAVPLGNLHAGIGVQFTDPRVVLVYSGGIALLLGLLGFRFFRAARTLD
jgi:MFS family permease